MVLEGSRIPPKILCVEKHKIFLYFLFSTFFQTNLFLEFENLNSI